MNKTDFKIYLFVFKCTNWTSQKKSCEWILWKYDRIYYSIDKMIKWKNKNQMGVLLNIPSTPQWSGDSPEHLLYMSIDQSIMVNLSISDSLKLTDICDCFIYLYGEIHTLFALLSNIITYTCCVKYVYHTYLNTKWTLLSQSIWQV